MSHRFFSIALVLIGLVPSLVSAQEVRSAPLDSTNGQHFCEQQKADFLSHTDFTPLPTWRSVHVKNGSFSLSLPFSDKWKVQDQILLPYTAYDNGSGSASITVNGQSSNQVRAIHFGRYRMDDITCAADTSIPLVTAMAGVREFSLGWQPLKPLSTIIKSAQMLPNSEVVPISIRIGKNEGTLIRGHVHLFGLSCDQDTLWFNVKGKTFNLSSTCRPMSYELLRIAASVALDK